MHPVRFSDMRSLAGLTVRWRPPPQLAIAKRVSVRLDTYAIFMFAGLDFHMTDTRKKWDAPESYGATDLNSPFYPGSATLRRAIRENSLSFPSQVPPLLKTSSNDMQWRVVLLYFVLGWSSGEICVRFHVPRHRIRQILKDWSVKALALGCMEVIDPNAFQECCRANAEQSAGIEAGLSTGCAWTSPDTTSISTT